MALIKKFFCPVNGWDCPYWKEDCSCSMIDEGLDPLDECDDAACFWDDKDGCPCVWVDENGNCYDVDELLEMGYHFVNGEPVMPPDDEEEHCFEPGRYFKSMFEINP